MKKRTASPWQIDDASDVYGGSGVYSLTEKTKYGGNRWVVLPSEENNIEDMKLIAAAPELLEVCKSAMVELVLIQSGGTSAMTSVILNKLHGIIKKAEGKEK